MAAIIYWPIPYDHQPNDFEVVGRYIAQTILMERFIDLILLDQDWRPRNLKRAKLTKKIDGIQALIEQEATRRNTWADLPDKMREVARNRNALAHRMFERGAIPMHYAQGLEYKRLTDEELHEQERQAFTASELCRQLVGWFLHAPLNPGYQFVGSSPTGPRSSPRLPNNKPGGTHFGPLAAQPPHEPSGEPLPHLRHCYASTLPRSVGISCVLPPGLQPIVPARPSEILC